MIREFSLQNQRTKKKVNFGQSIAFDFVFKDDGIDWGNIKANHNTFTFPNQIGSTISSSKMNERTVTIQAYVYSNIDVALIKQEGYENAKKIAYERMLSNKAILNEIINPNDYIRITIGEYFLEGKPDQTIMYGKNEADNNEYFCKLFISLFFANPMFKKEKKEENKLKESTPLFHFPLVLKNTGIAMSSREEHSVLPVYNEGDNQVGGIITLKAKDTIVNPSIEKIDTNEVIKINKTLSKGEVIIVNTNDGEKSIKGIVNGVEENYFKYWDFDNTWMHFEEGSTLIGYSTESGNESMLDISVEIYPEKFALEEM